jgi:poly(3-hydroxybutyrate) depolymerase
MSAGGSMVASHLMAHSTLIDGAAIIAGSPYSCGHLPDYDNSCTYPSFKIVRIPGPPPPCRVRTACPAARLAMCVRVCVCGTYMVEGGWCKYMN